ncbi:response regulator [Aquabacterium sp.]|uniref:response regulator n=1 Tax=Aquabacterium sp. TaxID=1872578 RepID=UPI002CE84BFA|nr:response regulator transcription factor [Aquabacterium sp.]HSW05480.1 response regulator transcription factor [Aquabacterium sp.]
MSGLRTYLVEDSALIRRNLIETLEELVRVDLVGTAEDGPTAVDWLRNPAHVFDLAIIDIFLKRGSGIDVLQAARSSCKNGKVVILTNFAAPEIRKRCLALGADQVFDKSNEIDQLLRYCERLASEVSGGPSQPAGGGEQCG